MHSACLLAFLIVCPWVVGSTSEPESSPAAEEVIVTLVKACPAFLSPVCGTDGVTYDNDCELFYANIEAEKEGKSVARLSHGCCDGYENCPLVLAHVPLAPGEITSDDS